MAVILNNYKIINQHFRNHQTLKEDLMHEHQMVIKFAETKWQLDKSRNIQFAIIDSDIKTPYCVIKTVISCPASLLFEYLVEDIVDTMTDWNKVTQNALLIEKINENESILQIISKVPVLNAREDLFYQLRVKNENTFFELSTGVESPTVPLKANVVRCDLHFCSKEINVIDDNTCSYIVIWQHNPKGVINTILSSSAIANILLKNMLHEIEVIKKTVL